jgi:Protein of unknown function (DUF4241)
MADALEDHVVASLLKQARLERLAGDEEPSEDEGRLVVAGMRLDVEEVAAGDDPEIAGLVASGSAGADAFALAEAPDGERILLLRNERLRDEPYAPEDLPNALGDLVGSNLPVEHRAALRRFADAAPPGYSVAVADDGAQIEAPGGTISLVFDDGGRITDIGGEIEGEQLAFGEEMDLVPLGELELTDGRLVAGDPFSATVAEAAEPLPGALPKGRHEVALLLHEDPAGGQRVRSAFLVVADGEVVEWEPVGAITIDSGVACFATPESMQRLIARGDEALPPLEEALAEGAVDTWEAAALDGIVLFSSGFGDGEYEVAWGYDADESLVCVAIDCLPDWQLEPEEPGEEEGPPRGSPGRGLQRGFLVAGAFGAEWAPQNTILLPPDANRAMASLERRVARTLVTGQDVEYQATPEYEGEYAVPVRVRVKATGGSAGFEAAVEIA